MVGIIVELAISRLLLWLLAKVNLEVLGFKPTRRRVVDLVVGLLAAGVICTIYHLSTTNFADNSWTVNPAANATVFAKSSYWTLKSVLFETLIFQGALLYLAIKKLGVNKACLLSAACFGIYHWFSYGAFGNPVQMAFIFFMTAITGLMYAVAFAKTGSLYLPVGLHLGWNIFNIVVFSNGPLGPQVLIQENQNKTQDILSLAIFLFQVFALPLLTYLYLKQFRKPIDRRAELAEA